jgi:SAM-dependent methyltransferase
MNTADPAQMAAPGCDWSSRFYTDQHPGFVARLKVTTRMIAESLAAAPEGEIRVLSLCCGDGRDLLGALQDHPRKRDVRALLVDRDASSVQRGQQWAREQGFDGQIEFVHGDAADWTALGAWVPFDVVIISGVFVHLTIEHAQRLVALLPTLCRDGSTVVWNRRVVAALDGHDPAGDPIPRAQLPDLQGYFAGAGFVTAANEETGPTGHGIFRDVYRGPSVSFEPLRGIFEFKVYRDPSAPRRRPWWKRWAGWVRRRFFRLS